MVKNIKVSNFKGIYSEMSLSFEANAKRKSNKYGIFKTNKKEILKTTSLMGKNASGKTSFIESIGYMNLLVSGNLFNSVKGDMLEQIRRKGDSSMDTSKINIKREDVIELLVKNDFNNIEESMFFSHEFIDSKSEVTLNVELSPKGEVSEVILLNGKKFSNQTVELEKYKSNIFSKELNLKTVVHLDGFSIYAELFPISLGWNNLLKNKYISKAFILEWLRVADDKIIEIIWTSKNEIKQFVISFNGNEKIISWSELSSGTKKWILIAQSIFRALFVKQSFLTLDEINRSLHPALSKFIITTFNDPKINKKKSQLFFTTHNPSIIEKPYRKDAINFIEDCNIVNLGDMKSREDLSIAKNYLNEKLGTHPSKSDMFDLLGDFYE